MSIPTRKLGGFQVNSIGFGAMGLSVGYGDAGSIEERLEVCKQLLYLNALILTFFLPSSSTLSTHVGARSGTPLTHTRTTKS